MKKKFFKKKSLTHASAAHLSKPKQTMDGVEEIGYGYTNTLSLTILIFEVLKTRESLFFNCVSIFKKKMWSWSWMSRGFKICMLTTRSHPCLTWHK